jgi:hypothetical protein
MSIRPMPWLKVIEPGQKGTRNPAAMTTTLAASSRQAFRFLVFVRRHLVTTSTRPSNEQGRSRFSRNLPPWQAKRNWAKSIGRPWLLDGGVFSSNS